MFILFEDNVRFFFAVQDIYINVAVFYIDCYLSVLMVYLETAPALILNISIQHHEYWLFLCFSNLTKVQLVCVFLKLVITYKRQHDCLYFSPFLYLLIVNLGMMLLISLQLMNFPSSFFKMSSILGVLPIKVVERAQSKTTDSNYCPFLVVHNLQIDLKPYIAQQTINQSFLIKTVLRMLIALKCNDDSDKLFWGEEPMFFFGNIVDKYRLKSMEAEQLIEKGGVRKQPLMVMLAVTTQLPIISCTLEFLDEDELVTLAELAICYKLTSQFFMVAVAKAFMKKYLNKVDRGIFFVFYEDLDFRNIEKNTINILASQHSHLLTPAYLNYKNILQAFAVNHQYLSTHIEFQALVQQLFLEPDLPMPKLKRESIGMFCETGFQEYLSLIKFPADQLQQWMEEPLEQLREHLLEQLEQLTQQMVYSDYGKQAINRKIRVVRFCGYKVNGQNWSEYLIEGFKTHNLIVLMLGLCSQMVTTFKRLLCQIVDPFMKFTEFALRSNIYRNIVLSIEQKFNFLFSNYSKFYSTCFTSSEMFPPLNFWRPALSIWLQQMKVFHQTNARAYNYITAKLRETNLKQLLAIKTQKLPSFFSELKREIDLQSFSLTRKNIFYKQNQYHLQMEAYFQINQDMYQTLAKDYIQYMVDISMNEFNVHWCGHSNHTIKNYPIFTPFIRNVVSETQALYAFIKEVLNHSVPNQIRLNIFKEVVKEDLLFSEQRLFKPMIIREITKMVNSWIKEDVESLSQFMVFNEEGYIKHKISLDFQEKDGLLAYFSKKYSIPEDCPEDFSFFYNIQFQDTEPQFFKEKQEQMQDLEQMEKYMSEQEEMQQDEQENNP